MDNTRLFLFAALAFVAMLLWQQWQADYGPKPAGLVDRETGQVTPAPGVEVVPDADLPDPATEVTPAGDDAPPAAEPRAEQQLIRVDTDVVQALIDTRGGVIRSLKLKQYPTSLDRPDDWLELIHSDIDSAHILQSGLQNKQKLAPTHHDQYRTGQQEYRLADGAEELVVPLTWSKDGIEVVKEYRFRRGDYMIEVFHRVDNGSDADWTGNQYHQIQRTRPINESRLL